MRITRDALTQLRREAVEAAGVEACGILWSDEQSRCVTGYSAYPGPLFAGRFRLDQGWLLKELYQARNGGRRVAGFYHTHPRTAAEPSSDDIQGHPPGSRFLILCPRGKERAFLRAGQGVRELAVVIHE